jgi:perosamine synthetase
MVAGGASAGVTITAGMIPVARPWMGEAEIDAVRRAVLSGWVTQGPEVAAFEAEFAAAVGASHACAVSSCTTALHLALLAVGVGRGDEVVTVSHSFIATANAVRYCDATPVFVDVSLDTFNIDPDLAEVAITDRTKALLVVHQLGMPCDLSRLVGIARRHGIAVVEDAACAVGSEIRADDGWQPIGRPHGDVACFSFHPRKLLSTGDGGMLTTNDPEIDAQVRLLRQHGMSVTDTQRHASAQVVYERYAVQGFNYRMTDIQAAIGREQLKRLPAVVRRRRELANRYREALRGTTGVVLPAEPDWARTNWQSYTVRLAHGIDQRTVMQRMLDRQVATRRGAMCAHREAAYPPGSFRCGRADAEGTCLHNSELAQDTTIVLPMYHEMSEVEQDRVVVALNEALG